MRKTFAAAVVVGVACMGAGVQRENGQDRSLEDQFEFVAEFHLGDVPRLDRRRAGESGAGGIAREEFGLQAGRTYFIVGVCDVNCSDIRLRLLGPDGASVAEHVRGGLYAIAGLTPETSGVFAVEVSMVECAAASCGWAVQAYARGTPFTDAARRHDGALAAGDDRYPTGDEFFDTYALDASAGEILIADLRSERFSPYLAVEAPSGAVLTDGDYGRNRSGVEVAVTETGRWTVRVTAVEPGSAGRYRLRLEARAPEGRTLLGPPVEGSPAEAGRGAVEAATAEPWPWSSYWHWRPRGGAGGPDPARPSGRGLAGEGRPAAEGPPVRRYARVPGRRGGSRDHRAGNGGRIRRRAHALRAGRRAGGGERRRGLLARAHPGGAGIDRGIRGRGHVVRAGPHGLLRTARHRGSWRAPTLVSDPTCIRRQG